MTLGTNYPATAAEASLPCPGGVKHTAWLRADRTLCSARPILSLPASDLHSHTRRGPSSMTAASNGSNKGTSQQRLQVFAAKRAALPCAGACTSVHECGPLPDDVASLREAARHKQPFDDVDFLTHCLRREEENGDSPKSKDRTQMLRSPEVTGATGNRRESYKKHRLW